MKAKVIHENEPQKDSQPENKTHVCYLEDGSDLDLYFRKVDAELAKKYNYRLDDDENL